MLNGDETDEEALAIVKSSIAAESGEITKIFDINNAAQLRKTYLPKTMYEYSYVVLDSSNRAKELSPAFTLGWYIGTNGSYGTGIVSCAEPLHDIIGMRICPSFIYYMSYIGGGIVGGKSYVNSLGNPNSKFTVLIKELQAQSYVGREGRKYHFSLSPEPMFRVFPSIKAVLNPAYPLYPVEPNPFNLYTTAPNFSSTGPLKTSVNPYLELTPNGNNDGWFWFKQPVLELNTITINVGTPYELQTLGYAVGDSWSMTMIMPIQFVCMNYNKKLN